MTIKLRCKSCFAKVSADDELIGKEVNCPNCNHRFTVPKSQFGFGKILGGYEIEQWLGSGAMGEVYLARQVSMNRPVALKVVKHDISMDREVVDRFTHEAQVLASLNHTNIVPAFDAGHTDDCYYMAMGFIDGETLEDRLKRKGKMDELEVLTIAQKVGGALRYAWEEFKLLHRDIKPANIMLDSMDEVKIMDMGIAKNTQDDGGLTKVGLVVGTPFYMSPEQAQASTGIDFRSDLYALAASMYHVLTGTLPFQGPNVMAILAKKVNFPLVPVNEINPDISQETTDMVAKLLSYRVDERLETFDEFSDLLAKAQSGAQTIKDSKRSEDEKTVHMKVPDKVLEHIANAKTRHVPQQKSGVDIKIKVAVIALLVLCIILALSLVLIGDKTKVEEGNTEIVNDNPDNSSADSTNTKDKSTVNSFNTETKKGKKQAKLVSSQDFSEYLKENTIIQWKANREDEETKKLEFSGASSVGMVGQMSLRKGIFTFKDDILDQLEQIPDTNEFSLLVNFRSLSFKQKEVCILSMGKDEVKADLMLIQVGENVKLIIRNTQKRDEFDLGRMNKLRTNIIISYGNNELLVYSGNRLVVERQGYKIDTNAWEREAITFGSFTDGKSRFWFGDIHSFAILKKSLKKEDIDKIFKMIVDGIRKKPKRPGNF